MIIASAEAVAGITATATLLGALGLGVVSIYTNQRRLAAERDRQAALLAHDRDLAVITDLRQVLDETAAVLNHLERVVHEGENTIKSAKSRTEEEHNKRGLQHELDHLLPSLVALRVRLAVRLGPYDGILRSLDLSIHSVQQIQRDLSSEKFILGARLRLTAGVHTFYTRTAARIGASDTVERLAYVGEHEASEEAEDRAS
jgi:hypothetical protein